MSVNTDHDRTLVVLPTYQESENISLCLRGLREHLPLATILVIDDASPDGTATIAEEMASSDARIVVCNRPGKLGLGSAHRMGLKYAVEHGFQAVLTMDADLSHQPADAPRLLARLRQPGVDVVVGSRYVRGGRIQGWPFARRALSNQANLLLRGAVGTPVRDCTGAFRAYDVALVRQLALDRLASTGYSAIPELLLLAASAGAVVVEEPITFVERHAGATKLTRRELVASLMNVLALYRRRRAAPRVRAQVERSVVLRGRPIARSRVGENETDGSGPARTPAWRPSAVEPDDAVSERA